MRTRFLFTLIILALIITACGRAPANLGGPAYTQQPLQDRALGEQLPEAAESDGDVAAIGAAAPSAARLPESAAEATDEAAEEPAQPPVDMFFEDYGTNPFVEASGDNLSTFAVDVDTGSYTLARSYLNDGLLPPQEAVRLEEFINYFEQDYPLPQDNTFGIHLEAAQTPFSAEDSYVLRVGIQGYDIAPDARPDAALIFVIDVSGSMDMENRLGAVKEALNMLITQLRPTDKIGIVVYGAEGRVLLEPIDVGQTSEVRAAINALQPDGSTNAEEGLRLAYDLATTYYDPKRINRLILCSDGVANVGVTGPDAILETVRQQATAGITLTTVGFGMGNYNDMLMEQLADDGDGQYFYVDSAGEAERIFVHNLTGTLQTIALNAKIQVEFNPQTVMAYRLMGYENRDVADDDFRNDDVDAGEIGSGHSVTALYEVIPVAGAQGTVATVRLRWEDPETHEITEITHSLDAGSVQPFEQASPRLQLDAAVAAFADVLGQGGWSQNASYDEILRVLERAAAALSNDPDVQELIELVQRANELE